MEAIEGIAALRSFAEPVLMHAEENRCLAKVSSANR
jgi:hypothetical protein